LILNSQVIILSPNFNHESISVFPSHVIPVSISTCFTCPLIFTDTIFLSHWLLIALVFNTNISSFNSLIISTSAVIHESTFLSKFGSSRIIFTSYDTTPEFLTGVVSIFEILAFTGIVA